MEQVTVAGKVVGFLDPNGVLHKSGKQVMLFRIFDGFGVARDLLKDPRVKRLSIEYDGFVYEAEVEVFEKQGIEYQRDGFERQVILPRKWFVKHDPSQVELW